VTAGAPDTESLTTMAQTSRERVPFLITLFTFSLFRLPPWLPFFVTESDGVDPSWQMFLHEAVKHGWRYGSEVLFTYGPLGFLHTRMYHPETWCVVACVWTVLAVITADLVWRVTGHGNASPAVRALLGIVIIEFLSLDVMAFCFGLQGLVYLDDVAARNESPSEKRIIRPLRAGVPLLFVAALPWAKFSYLPTVCLLIVTLGILALLRRKVPVQAVVLTFALVAAWFVSGGTLNELSAYITSGLQLAGGYGSAMGLGPTGFGGNAVIALSGVVVLLVPLWMANRPFHRARFEQVLTWLFFSGLLFVVWKSAFVRFHAGRFPVFLGTILSLGAAGWSLTQARERINRGLLFQAGNRSGHAVLLLLVMMALNAEQFSSVGHTVAIVVEPSVLQVQALANSVIEPDWRLWLHQSQVNAIQEANPIPSVSGTVDVFPSKLSIAFSHKLKLTPRPVIQSYASFMPELIGRNGQHFCGAKAPDQVLFSVTAIDGRLPAMEDPRVWLELADQYAVGETTGQFVQLVRRPSRGLTIGNAAARSAQFGEPVELPATLRGPVWCRVLVTPTRNGKLAGLLYRQPELLVDLTVRGGEFSRETFRMIPGSAESGFLLSPVIESNDDAIAFWSTLGSGGDLRKRVESIACRAGGPSWTSAFFEPEIRFEFSPIVISGSHSAPAQLAERRSSGSLSE
jgi:hypothetical protein